MATHLDSHRLEVNPSSQVLRIMIPPHITAIDQHQSLYQSQPIMDGNMMNNNPQGIQQPYEQPNLNQPRVHINVDP